MDAVEEKLFMLLLPMTVEDIWLTLLLSRIQALFSLCFTTLLLLILIAFGEPMFLKS